MNSPCNGCMDRVLGCHAGCERYNGFRTVLEAENAARRRYHEQERMDVEHARRHGHRR